MEKKVEIAAIDSPVDPDMCRGDDWGKHGEGEDVNVDGRKSRLSRGGSIFNLAKQLIRGMCPDEAIELTSGQ